MADQLVRNSKGEPGPIGISKEQPAWPLGQAADQGVVFVEIEVSHPQWRSMKAVQGIMEFSNCV